MTQDERQLVDLLNEKVRTLQHEKAVLSRENRQLKREIKNMQKEKNQ